MKIAISIVLILALFVAGVASEEYVELFVQEDCCDENEINKEEFKKELVDENFGRLLRDQEEERLVDELLNGPRDLQVDCAKSCRTYPTGYWCLVVCKGRRKNIRRRDVRAVQETEPICTEFPMKVPELIKRLKDKNAKLENCKLEKEECLILRKCVD